MHSTDTNPKFSVLLVPNYFFLSQQSQPAHFRAFLPSYRGLYKNLVRKVDYGTITFGINSPTICRYTPDVYMMDSGVPSIYAGAGCDLLASYLVRGVCRLARV